jgi:glutamate synthase (ferredoxin)
VVVLGATGRNFAAGMSGGVAYVLDTAGDFAVRCNKQMVGLEKIETKEEAAVPRQMVERHAKYTGSARAAKILKEWDRLVPKFIKVMPKDYKRVLEALERVKSSGLSGEEAIMAAFEANARDLSRVGGN